MAIRELWRKGPRVATVFGRLLFADRRRLAAGFEFKGRRFPFLIRVYNRTWANERQVEVPLMQSFLAEASPDETLEVGNVLAHYIPVQHRVVDKYERAAGVLNEDFLEHERPEGYRLILAISTFEHIGWDETSRDARGFRHAVRHAQTLLQPGGLLAFSVPLGYNPEVDDFLAHPGAEFSVGFLERFGARPGEWREAKACDGRDHPYDSRSLQPTARAIAVVTYRAPGPSTTAPER